jgi:hypothetical protein
MTMRITKWLAAMALALAIMAICIVSITAISGRQTTAASNDMNSAQRYMAYRVDRTQGPRFSISPGAWRADAANQAHQPTLGSGTVIKLLVVAAIPPTAILNQRLAWGLEITVVGAGNIDNATKQMVPAPEPRHWKRVVYMESRQSRDGDIRGTYDLQSGEYSDEREVELTVPTDSVGQLSIRLADDSATDHVLVRVFAANPRSQSEVENKRDQLLASIENDSSSMLTDVVPVIPHVALLPPPAVRHRLAQRFTKLLPMGDSGADYQMQQVLIGRFRQPPPERSREIQHVIDRNHWIALTVRGPGRLTIRQVSGPQQWRVESADNRDGARPHDGLVMIAISNELTSISLQSQSDVADTVSIESDGVVQISPNYQPGESVVGPDTVRIPVEIADGAHTIELGVIESPSRPGLDAAIRVDVRQMFQQVPVSTQSDPSSSATTISLTFRDVAGNVLLRQNSEMSLLLSPFEQVIVDGEPFAVTEPQFLRVLPPPGCRTVSITSVGMVALRFSRWLPLADRLDEPYYSALSAPIAGDSEQLQLAARRWRYARMETRQWQPFFSLHYADSELAQPKATLVAQVRLVESGVDDQLLSDDGKSLSVAGERHKLGVSKSVGEQIVADDATAFMLRTLTPMGNAEQQKIREIVDGDQRSAVLAQWPNDAVTALLADTPYRIGFAAPGVDGAAIGWRCEAGQLGQTVRVLLDGVEISIFDLTTTSGSWILPAGIAGSHLLTVQGADKVTLWVNRPPIGASVAGSQLLRLRTVWAMAATPVRVRVPQRQGRNVSVYAVVYGPGMAADDRVMLRFTVGGGSPSRALGVLPGKMTIADRQMILPAASKLQRQPIFVDRPGASLGQPRVIRLGLLDDLVGGNQVLTAYNQSRKALWVRFVARAPSEETSTRAGVKITRAVE